MIPVHPIAVEIEHRASYLRGAPNQSLFLAASEDGSISTFGVDGVVKKRGKQRTGVCDVCLHPFKESLALIEREGGKLRILDMDGTTHFEQEGPPRREKASAWVRDEFASCFFDESGHYLWCAMALSPKEIEVHLLETSYWLPAGSIVMEDPFYESYLSFHRTSKRDVTALWVGCGQDGRQVYWLRRNAIGLTCEREPCLEDCGPPVFSPSGNQFLALGEDRALRLFQFPEVRQIGICPAPWEENDFFGFFLGYLDESHAVVSTDSSRVFMLDVRQMKVVDEVLIQNHEPRPKEEVFPSRVGHRELCTDIRYFDRLGDVIIFVFRRDKASLVGSWQGWKDTLLCVPVKDIIAHSE